MRGSDVAKITYPIISFYNVSEKQEKITNRTKNEKLSGKGKKSFRRKECLKNPKRNIVANLGKQGIIREHPYWIYDEGCDVTPKPLKDRVFHNIPSHHEGLKISNIFSARAPKGLATTSQRTSLTSFQDRRASSVVSKMTLIKLSESNISLNSLIIKQPTFSLDTLLNEDSRQADQDKDSVKSLVPSMFELRIPSSLREFKPTSKFTINLTETETMILLEIPSNSESLESEEGISILKSNSNYEQRLQATKAISQAAIQTDLVGTKNRALYIPRNKRANASTFVSRWEMYDTYEALKGPGLSMIISQEEGQMVFRDEDADTLEHSLKFQYRGSNFSNRLLDALMIIERLIVSGEYRQNQLTYNGSFVQDPFSLEVLYNYSLKHLWTFYHENIVRKRTVTSLCWNEENHNLLAVGYGKFYYRDECNGLVCIWNIKNPLQPERFYEFEHPVTFVSSHPVKKQILAVTFYNGSVILIDIISWRLLIKANNDHYPCFSPVSQARWFPSLIQGNPHVLITCGKNGRIYRYRKNKFFTSKKIMTVGRMHGRIQGVEMPKPCYPKKTLNKRNPGVEVLVPYPADPTIYLVGTSNGCIYICSVLHRYEHLDVLQAHSGPVCSIQFNPFCKKVFLSCGADWCIRLWVVGIPAPLVTLQSGMAAVQDAVWSPLHSTVIVSATGKQVEMWDLRRRISTPKSSLAIPADALISKLYFSANGYNICIGDLHGHVHVMAMTEMPFSPIHQEEILVEALKSALVNQPDLLHKLELLGKPFSSDSDQTAETKIDRQCTKLITRAQAKLLQKSISATRLENANVL